MRPNLQGSLRARSRRRSRTAWCPPEVLEARRLLATIPSVLNHHGDLASTGLNPNETILKPSNVNSTNFGKLFANPVDGNVYAQPLYVPGVAIPGQGTHNVVYVATQHDSVYAFDADGGAAPLWKTSFINPAVGVTTVPSTDLNTGAISPEIGITGTPVIDPATSTLYVVAMTKEVSGGTASYVQRLHALDITTGAEKFGGPVVIQATINGNGAGNDGKGHIAFNAKIELQRPGLLLYNGVVYIGWASFDDQFDYHGWLIGYNAQTLQQTAVWNATPDGAMGGIWQGGGAPTVDAAGNIYVTVGNGTFNANVAGGRSYGDSIVKLSTSGGGLTVVDYFTPFNQADLSATDKDFGSGSAMLLPDQPGVHPHELVTAGKEGRIYLADRDNLGQYDPAGDHVVQEVTAPATYIGNFSTPSYFNGTFYFQQSGDTLKAYSMSNGTFSATPSSHSSTGVGFPGATLSISANGTADGIVWEWQYGNPGVLHAYDATNLANELYNSNQAGARDQVGGGVKFAVPTVVNGKVYVGTQSGLAVFGLFPGAGTGGENPPDAPSNLSATAASPTQVNLSWTDNSTNETGFEIDRSTDGVTFTTITTVSADVTVYGDTGLTPSTTYTYRVRATNVAGDSADSKTAVATTSAAPPDPSIVGYWKLDDGTGLLAADSSGNNQSGALYGEVSWIPGMVGPGALNFHGVGTQDPHVVVADSPDLRFTAAQSFTVAAWVDPFSLSGKWMGIVTKSRDIPSLYGIWIDPSNRWIAGGPANPDGTSGNLVGSVATLGWHYVAVVQDGAAQTRRLYVDGSVVASGLALDASGTGELWFGGSKSVSEYFDGAIDDVRIYNRALAASEIQAIAPALSASYTSTPPTSWDAGQTQTYTITVMNTGTQTWNASGSQLVRLGVEFGTASDYPADGWATDQRFSLPGNVVPGASVTMTVNVTPPGTANSYVLRHRMVKENVAWFGQMQKTAVTVSPTAASSLVVTGYASPTTAGTPGSVTVTARDPYGNVATGYTGTVAWSTSDGQAALPASYTFSASDGGVHTFSATLKTAGTQSITATDAANALSGSQTAITVNPAAASRFILAGFPSPITAGVAGGFTVTATDPFGNRATGYRGTVSFSSSDGQAALPASYTFAASDGGVHTFSATLKTAGTQSITATDAANALSGSQTSVKVNPAAASRLVMSTPATATVGVPVIITITALDAFGNIATGYLGTVGFSSSDSKAVLPLDYTFTATDQGVHRFSVTFKTKGNRTVTVVDRSKAALTATSGPIKVS